MNFLGSEFRLRKSHLPIRNESKIKTFDSCEDIRAWSHDMRIRDSYLRDWIKSDMPLCVVPVSTLICFFRKMTFRRRGRAAPRCHANCKSKVILDSITHTCDAVKECLKTDENLEKFFIEEELETSNWPCEKCLDALKGVKMFWKILLEKVFSVNVRKNECYYHEKSCCTSDSVRDLAKAWERDMVHQAVYVKSVNPEPAATRKRRHYYLKGNRKRNAVCYRAQSKHSDGEAQLLSCKDSNLNIDISKSENKSLLFTTSMHTDLFSVDRTTNSRKNNKASVKSIDVGCNSNTITQNGNFDSLQKTNDTHLKEIESLKNENIRLKTKLQNMLRNCNMKSIYCLASSDKENYLVPKPFESLEECSSKVLAKDAESELIITMKNCKNENYRHVSLLQVLHKTNDPYSYEVYDGGNPVSKREDPIRILTKVQTTLETMIRREMSKAECHHMSSNANTERTSSQSEIKASFHRVQVCNLTPSCSTFSSTFTW